MKHKLSAEPRDVDAASEPGCLILVDDQKREMAAFQPYARTMDTFDSMPALGSASIGQFNQLFSNAPQLASLSAASSEQLVLCSIDYDKLIDAKDKAGKLGIARKEGSNQIGDHVRLNKPEELHSIVTTGMVFNVVSTLVAQKHLAEINQKLDLILNGIKQIQAFQKDERSAAIKAFHEQIQSCIQHIAEGQSISNHSLQAIATNLHNLRKIALHIKNDVKKSVAQIEQNDFTSLFGSDAIRTKMKEALGSAGMLCREYMLVLQCLVMANAILFFHAGFHEENRSTARNYLDELDAFDGIPAQWKKYRSEVNLKLNKIHPLFEFRSSTEANVKMVEKAAAQIQKQVEEDNRHLTQISAMFFPQKALQIVLEISDGQVVAGKYLT